MKKYFEDKNLTPNDVKGIEVVKTRMNCYNISFNLDNNDVVFVGPFSGETMTSLISYWNVKISSI